MEYLKPRLPEKEIELCLDLFDKQEAKKRILQYIEGVFDDAESQFKNCFMHDAVGQSEKLKHFDFIKCIKFWDSFNFELYVEVLKAKKNERL